MRSQEWQEHAAFHEERGETAVLVVQQTTGDESVTRELSVNANQDAPSRDHHTSKRQALTGGCQCQSPSVRLLLGDDGTVKNEPDAQIETNSYGVVVEETTGYLGSSSGTVNYRPNSEPNTLYGPK